MSSRWEAFASREPYFAVLTEARFLRANLDAAAEEEFFRSGEEHVSDLFATLAAGVAPHFQPRTILEYGCGVGRLAIPFSRRAGQVTAVDLSPAMLAHAREHAARAGAGNIEFLLPHELDTRATFDLVNCYLVLQRMRPADGLALLRRLAQQVRPGGVGVFHLPYRSPAPRAVRLTRSLRAKVPGANAVANILRHKPASTPLIETHVYDLNDVIAVLHEQGFDAPQLVIRQHAELESAIVYATRRQKAGAAVEIEDAAVAAPLPDGLIDVRRLISETSIDELNELAERYFASLDSWEHHLGKPFARVEDTPQLLISVGTLLQGLALSPGMTVLEYGAGTGWLSRFLTQLGCRMVLLDVAPTALKIARELYERQPVIGDRPEPRFLVFDGRRIEMDDASVDRIICFDSFHHATNPTDVLREFARVMKPGGIAGFIEPGPEHSRSAQSQYEMRTYGVVENDIDIHAIWSDAQSFGFTDLRLAAFNVPPFHVPLAQYDDLLASGETFARWADATRQFMRNVRAFFLFYGETEERDSRRPEGLRAAIEAEVVGTLAAGRSATIHVTVRNAGHVPWLPSEEPAGGVSLGCHLYDASGRLLNFEFHWQGLPRPLEPGEAAEMTFEIPPLASGRYILELDCVANQVAWFGQLGSPVTRLTLTSE